MRRLSVLIYVAILAAGIYFAYQWNQQRLPQRQKLAQFSVQDVQTLVIRRGQIELRLEPDAEDEERWIFSTNLDNQRAYSLEARLVLNLLDSLHSAPFAYLVEPAGSMSLQHYGLGVHERYEMEIWQKGRANAYTIRFGALAVNGYDTFILQQEHVYRATFIGLHERLEALGKVIDVIIGSEDRIF
jgi:hypothetical protein